MVVLGLRFCARAFSSCGERGPLFIAVRGPLTIAASLVAEHRLQTRRLSCVWLTGLVAPRHVGSSQTRARTRVPCIGRQTLNHCATREAPTYILFQILFHSIECLLSLSSMHIRFLFKCPWGFPGGAVVENLPDNAGDTGSSPGLGGSHMPRSN